jgi:hypothetical protein
MSKNGINVLRRKKNSGLLPAVGYYKGDHQHAPLSAGGY